MTFVLNFFSIISQIRLLSHGNYVARQISISIVLWSWFDMVKINISLKTEQKIQRINIFNCKYWAVKVKIIIFSINILPRRYFGSCKNTWIAIINVSVVRNAQAIQTIRVYRMNLFFCSHRCLSNLQIWNSYWWKK